MENANMTWRKASYSSNGGGNCVEVASQPGTVAVRDSKAPDGPRLSVPAADWQAFTRAVRSR
jgi:hypothetical protein